MKMIALLFVVLAAAPSFAQRNQVVQLFQSILSGGANGTLPAHEELFAKVNENTVGALSVSEINDVLPLARQCLQSRRAEVRQDGLVLMMAVSTRADSTKLMDAYIDDLGALLSGPEGAISLRHGALYILGSTKPRPDTKAINYLSAHLEDSRNSNEEALTIAASLLESSPTDAATVHKTLAVVARRGDPGLTTGVMKTLGLLKTRNPEALSLLGTGLNGGDRFVRESAVEAVSRLETDVRGRFAPQLARIAADPNETENARALARAALR
jgi:hypothetical protein